MTKLLTILLIGLIFEAVGVVFLSKGLKQLGEVQTITLPAVLGLLKDGATNRHILLGILFEAMFFGSLLYLMSKGDVSLVWPLTALGFVLTTLAARFVLHEEVTWLRWAGVLLIMAGAAIITWTEKHKSAPSSKPQVQAGTSRSPVS